MIDALNTKIQGKQGMGGTFELLPKGKYEVQITKISDWVGKTLDIKVNRRGVDNKVVKAADGKTNVKDLITGYTLYESDVEFTIVVGDHAKRKVFCKLSTHPDLMFRAENLLWAVEEKEATLNEIQKVCLGKRLSVDVDIDTYNKKETDPTTSKEILVPKSRNDVKGFAKPSLISDVTEEEAGV